MMIWAHPIPFALWKEAIAPVTEIPFCLRSILNCKKCKRAILFLSADWRGAPPSSRGNWQLPITLTDGKIQK